MAYPARSYRGLKDVEAHDEFFERGGTELAPMSTTSDLAVAVQYSRSVSSTSILFRIRTRSSMERGADISLLSAFPGESEILFPPLVYLQPTGHAAQTVVLCGTSYKVVEVEPRM